MFKIKPKMQENIDLDDIRELTERSPAKSWVNSFLMSMQRGSIGDFTLQKSDGIPSIPVLDNDNVEGELDFDKIINRLKIMSGLDPILFSDTRQGKIELFIGGIPYIVETQFIDSASNSICQIRMSKKNEKENSGK